MMDAIQYPNDDLPRHWPHFDAGWYIRMNMHATFGPYTHDEAWEVYARRAANLGFLPDDDIFCVAEPTDMDVLRVANDLGGV